MNHDLISWDSALGMLAQVINEHGCPASWLQLPKRIRDKAVMRVVNGTNPMSVMKLYCSMG